MTAAKNLQALMAVAVLAASAASAQAPQTPAQDDSHILYKWVDDRGGVTYQDTVPEGDVEYEEQDYADYVDTGGGPIGQALRDASRENPVTLYVIPDCDACDLVRRYLSKHSIPFTEQNITNRAAQEELLERAGQLSAPTVVVGDSILDGYSRSAMKRVLTEKGYPIAQLAQIVAAEGVDEPEPQTPASQ